MWIIDVLKIKIMGAALGDIAMLLIGIGFSMIMLIFALLLLIVLFK